MEGIDFLDFDDDLEADAQVFGAQGDAGKQVDPAVDPGAGTEVDLDVHQPALSLKDATEIRGLEEVLQITQEVYGETNSEYSQVFSIWVEGALQGIVNINETKELMGMLCEERFRYGGKHGCARSAEEAGSFKARYHAVVAAQNVAHAVLNRLKGRPYKAWLGKALWRITQTEKDRKDRY